ncbi:uncharacterized protein LY79DRAFT_167254 [Colletotrichum navitas]|uniref:Uncharacterized protein n=1 Tax=Colletotrichum navitas TaxID=681940 RepID=A0AAD8Q1Y4_9PEZI|nr:uncharacterized protein LY79DRAFT_167254 [Colletotrichum navitas]KAK1594024.1 hypothetical protein LY79DRAFT_167254 [Colletotrichum navitas]
MRRSTCTVDLLLPIIPCPMDSGSHSSSPPWTDGLTLDDAMRRLNVDRQRQAGSSATCLFSCLPVFCACGIAHPDWHFQIIKQINKSAPASTQFRQNSEAFHSILVLVVARIPKSSPCVAFRASEARLQDPSVARSLSDGMACSHSSNRGHSQDSVATGQGWPHRSGLSYLAADNDCSHVSRHYLTAVMIHARVMRMS